MLKVLLPVLLLVSALILFSAGEARQPRADFVFVNRGSIQSLDPQRMTYTQDMRIGDCIYEGLLRIDNFDPDWRVIPGVAKSWEVSPDGLTYTFHLRQEARWSNGEPVTAADFVYSWERALLPDTAADYVDLFQLIKGGREFFDFRRKQLVAFASSDKAGDAEAALQMWRETQRWFAEHVGIQAADERTLIVTLEARTPYFTELCAFAPFYPVYRPLVDQYVTINPRTGRLIQKHGWTKPPLHVGNGPFVLKRWRFKRDMYLEVNPYYWDKSSINISSIGTVEIDDPNTMVLAFQTGAVDWVSSVHVDYKADMIAAKQRYYEEHAAEVEKLRREGKQWLEIDELLPPDPRKNIHAFPAFGTYFYNFNCGKKLPDGRDNPFHDARVRKAFALALDKQRIVDTVTRLHEPVARTFIPPGSLGGYHSPAGLGYDVNKALELLAEAGWKRRGGDGPLVNEKGEPFIVVEILYNTDGDHEDIATDVKNQWETALGVQVELRGKEIKVYGDDLDNHNFTIGRGSWYGDYGDPTTFLDKFRTGNGNNDAAYSNPVYDEMMDRARDEADAAKRLDILSEAERFVMEEELPILPIYHYVEVYLFNANHVTGLTDHPRQSQFLYRIDIMGDGYGRDQQLGSALR
ncbi:MAG TPA: peptide ABC transporter substrate-binding protein [Phycisphaeraceae bacterium]|nr:peptide ABC transporter substrate-binding protein [Phycisphaeraceae bacterium]